ncbi:hypothetical protein [Leuconostoc litchii]|uniref:hypothetical protein n=1 Tax=Leuconostoc litchii TaxID=1981069 RepID=UPI0024E0EB31|nr:hypothetical protein [Leuconostoc litchii]
MISINQLLTYQRKLRSNDYILLNQLLDDVEVGAFLKPMTVKVLSMDLDKNKHGQKCPMQLSR